MFGDWDLRKKLLYLLLLQYGSKKLKHLRVRPNRLHQRRKNWKEYYDWLTAKEFQRRFRMSKTAFTRLVALLRPELEEEGEEEEEERRKSAFLLSMQLRGLDCGAASGRNLGRRRRLRKKGMMLSEVKVAITLRFLAGGQMLDIADHFGYSLSTVYRVKQETVLAILQLGKEIGPIEFKSNDQLWLEEKATLYQGA